MSSFQINLNRIIFNDKDKMHTNIISLIKCKICFNVLADPYDCLCCNQTFCLNCISNFMNKSKKCPFDVSNLIIEDDTLNNYNIMSRLKPSCFSLKNFLSNLKFSCVNKGCVEEICYNNIPLHELNCQFSNPSRNTNLNNNNNTNLNTSNNNNLSYHNESFQGQQRKLSIMSFNTNNFLFDNPPHLENPIQADKLDKILDFLSYIQFSINNRNIFSTPTKDFYTETPKFSLSFNTNANNLQHTAESNFNNNYNLNLNLQHEKIISEIEYLSDKIISLENLIENNFSNNENLIKKIIDDQFYNLVEKIRDVPSTVNSSNNNSISNSMFMNPGVIKKSQSSNKLELQSSALKKIVIDKTKFKEKDKSVSPLQNKSTAYSPRIIKKTLFKEKEGINNKVYSNGAIGNIGTKFNSIQVDNIMSPLKQKKDIIEELNILTQNLDDKFTKKIELLENKISSYFNNNIEIMKKHINESLVEEIKTVFIEVTLDSTNLVVQRFDDLIDKIKLEQKKI